MSEASRTPRPRRGTASRTKKRTGARLFFHKLRLLLIALTYALFRAIQRAGMRKTIRAVALAALCVVLLVIEVKMIRFNAPSRSDAAAAQIQTEQGEEKKPQAVKDLEVKATDDTKPGNLIRSTTIIVDGTTRDSYSFDKPIRFGDSADYTDMRGVITFRGNNYRNGASYGTADLKEKKVSVVWKKTSSALQAPDGEVWTGSGWTGQPLIVTWPKETRKIMNMESWAKEADSLTEVIYATMDGHVYFFELETGKRAEPSP